MYSYDFICTYKLLKDYKDNDIDPNENDHLSSMLYQMQLLEAFNLKIFDENKMKISQEELYTKIKNHDQFVKIFDLIKEKFPQLCADNLGAFIILFSYDYFDIFHRCLIDYFTKKLIEEDNYNTLIKYIKN